MKKVLITNTNISWNKGAAAQVISVILTLRKFIPDVHFTLLSYFPELDSAYCSSYGIDIQNFSGKYKKDRSLLIVYTATLLLNALRCILYSILNRLHIRDVNLKINDEHLRPYVESDLILDLSGDSFSDWHNRSILNILTLFPATVLRKNFILFSQSIGPFNFWTLPFAKLCLSRSNLIVIREEVTKRYLENLNISNKFFIAADCAFLLPPVALPETTKLLKYYGIAEKDYPVIGVSVSVFMMDHFYADQDNNYLSAISKLVDYIIETKGAYVILIPHAIAPSAWGHDDAFAIRAVYRLIRNKGKVRMILNDHDPRELKAIIGQCNLFIGCRMHANIAAISQGIPTIAVGWSHKYYGIMQRVGLANYVIDGKKLSFEKLRRKFDELSRNSEQLRETLKLTSADERKSALDAMKLVSELLN